MSRSSGILVATACVFAITISLVPGHNYATGEQPKQVIVTPVPLPVTGEIGVRGTPNVNIANVPAVNAKQSGTWEVAVSGTPAVVVSNTPANPIPVQDVATAALEPFQMICDVHLSPGNAGTQSLCRPAIPPGKLFVIEYLTARTLFSQTASRALVTLYIYNGKINLQYSIPLGILGLSNSDGEYWESATPLKLYAAPSAAAPAVNVGRFHHETTGTASTIVSLSGHLRDAQ